MMYSDYHIRSLAFNPGAAAFTLTSLGSQVLIIGGGGVLNQSINLQTIDSGLVLSNSQTWDAGPGGLRINGTINLQTHTLTVGGSQAVTNAGIISGAGGLVKSGSGALTLTAANTYSGGTIVNGGQLAINNASGSATGTGDVVVNNGGLLTGAGTLSGNVTLNAGAAVAAGNSPGQLSVGGMTWAGGAANHWEINDVDAGASVGWDILDIAGVLQVTATSANPFTINVASLALDNTPGVVHDFDASQSYNWTFARTGLGILFTPGEDETTVFQLLLGGFNNALDGGNFSVALGNSGRDLNLVFDPAPIPEPSAGSLIALGLAALSAGQWMRRRS